MKCLSDHTATDGLTWRMHMTTGNLIFWIAFFGAFAVLLTCTSIAALLQPVPLVLAAVVLTVFHEHA